AERLVGIAGPLVLAVREDIGRDADVGHVLRILDLHLDRADRAAGATGAGDDAGKGARQVIAGGAAHAADEGDERLRSPGGEDGLPELLVSEGRPARRV